jgi:putative redox protein
METKAKAVIHDAGNGYFIGTSPSGHSITLDIASDRSTGATPMELLLIALGSCTAVDVANILRKKRQDVTDYRVEVSADRREEQPRAFTKFYVHHIVYGRNVSEQAVARAIELSDTRYCSVAATLRPAGEIETSFEIIEAEKEEASAA